jgi:hypothetical protein
MASYFDGMAFIFDEIGFWQGGSGRSRMGDLLSIAFGWFVPTALLKLTFVYFPGINSGVTI